MKINQWARAKTRQLFFSESTSSFEWTFDTVGGHLCCACKTARFSWRMETEWKANQVLGTIWSSQHGIAGWWLSELKAKCSCQLGRARDNEYAKVLVNQALTPEASNILTFVPCFTPHVHYKQRPQERVAIQNRNQSWQKFFLSQEMLGKTFWENLQLIYWHKSFFQFVVQTPFLFLVFALRFLMTKSLKIKGGLPRNNWFLRGFKKDSPTKRL